MDKKQVERYRILKLLKELSTKVGRGTEFVSLYIPPGRPLGDVSANLREEYGTANNIKSRTTRKNVLDALESIQQRLKLFREVPPNGLVMFCGAVPQGEAAGSEKTEIFVLEPPKPVPFYLYRCDSRFYLDPLLASLSDEKAVGLIALGRDEAGIGVVSGKDLRVLDVMTSGVPGKVRVGGQSARRYQRVLEQLVHEFFVRVAERANKEFVEMPNLQGIFVGGPGPTKEDFIKEGLLDYRLKDKIIDIIDLGYSGEEGLRELVNKIAPKLKDVSYAEEIETFEELKQALFEHPESVALGQQEVDKAFKQGNVKKLLISEAFDVPFLLMKCDKCDYEIFVRASERPDKCPACEGGLTIVKEESGLDHYLDLALEVGADILVFSAHSESGEQFLRSYSGIAAFI
ncbi:MAG: peptide chain release factor aRF-1 [Thermoprotei archaeon]